MRIGTDGRLREHERMFVKVRHNPFSVYIQFLSPAKLKGRRSSTSMAKTMATCWPILPALRERSYDIRGNVKTKDKVIRRELAISPGEIFDMVRVKISKQRLEGLQYFDKVDMQPEPTDPPIAGRKNLEVNVEEQNTGKFTLGAGFSSVDSLVGFAEITQGNFDLFHPPYFTGGGQKLRLFVQFGHAAAGL